MSEYINNDILQVEQQKQFIADTAAQCGQLIDAKLVYVRLHDRLEVIKHAQPELLDQCVAQQTQILRTLIPPLQREIDRLTDLIIGSVGKWPQNDFERDKTHG